MYRRSSVRSRARGNALAADQQRDLANVVINQDMTIHCGENMIDIEGLNFKEDFYDTGVTAINVFDVLLNNEFFNNYVTLYDQVKIDTVRAKIIGVNWISGKDSTNTNTNNNNNNNQDETYKTPRSYIVVTAWDRTGLNDDQVILKNNMVEVDGELYDQPCLYTNIGRNLSSYSSSMSKHLGPGSNYEIVRQLYPSTLAEKSQFISTSNLVFQQSEPDPTDFKMKLYKIGQNIHGSNIPVDNNGDPLFHEPLKANYGTFDAAVPNNLLQTSSIPFKPTLLVNVIAGNPPSVVAKNNQFQGVNMIKPITFNIEFHVAVTFRGLRYSKYIQ